MSDFCDRAAEREAEMLSDCLADQRRRAGLEGKTMADSGRFCGVCAEPIPDARRQAVPGVQTCVDCQDELDRVIRRSVERRFHGR
jgi:phage/conjugal plasmid C-4 type zinc finger TraR family protein